MADNRKLEGDASWVVHDEPDIGYLWYIALADRVEPPYLRQVHVEAIVDLDVNGCVAGIEIVDPKMAPPPEKGDP